MSLGLEPDVPVTRPVDIPGSLISTLARDPPKRVPGRQANSVRVRRDNNKSEDENDPPPPVQGPAPPPGGSDGDPVQDDNEDEVDEDDRTSDSEMGESEDEQPDDPDNTGMGKFYKRQTPHGKALLKIFRHFCNLAE